LAVATLRVPVSLPETGKASAKGLLARFYAAIVEARMRAALREIAMHRNLIPENALKSAGYTASLSNDSAFPFTK
jgi:hypothetical protein